MLVRLFDIQNGKVIPTEHCYIMKSLKDIMEHYPDNYLKIYQFLFYKYCPNPDVNPFFNVPINDKEEMIMTEIEGDFSTEDEDIIVAEAVCKKLYETPTSRAYYGIATMLDRLSSFMQNTAITTGRDGNMNSIIAAAKNFQDIRNSFKGVYKDLADEQESNVRGKASMAYDQVK
jgi:hypothetical protein